MLPPELVLLLAHQSAGLPDELRRPRGLSGATRRRELTTARMSIEASPRSDPRLGAVRIPSASRSSARSDPKGGGVPLLGAPSSFDLDIGERQLVCGLTKRAHSVDLRRRARCGRSDAKLSSAGCAPAMFGIVCGALETAVDRRGCS